MPGGRPTIRSEDTIQAICDGLCAGITLREICRREDMPARTTLHEWLEKDTALSERIARARELGFDVLAEEALEIAEDGSNDYMDRKRADGSVDRVLDAEHVQRSKLRIETRQKLLAIWSPTRFAPRRDDGASLQVAIATTLNVVVQYVDPAPLPALDAEVKVIK